MELKKLSERIYYYPHQPETDRPMLTYIKGDKVNLAIDAGNSAAHVDEFYDALRAEHLNLPDLTVITHWHWDHTFGMHHIHGLSIAHARTNEFLREEQIRLQDDSYLDFLKQDNEHIEREYRGDIPMVIALSDIEFIHQITLKLGGITAQAFHTRSPHSEDTVLIYIPEEKILFLGDSTSEDFFNNGYMDWTKLNALVHVIENLDCEYCILSHTEPLKKADLLQYLYSIMN